MNTLYLDTTDNKVIEIALDIAGKKDTVKREMDFHKSQIILPMVEELLKKHALSLTDLNAIEVATGKGSFTGIRVGVAIANTLGWILKIPVNGTQDVLLPTYS
jgi:tRNA threonylcarbamoyl adenosine modification protein YeaZ